MADCQGNKPEASTFQSLRTAAEPQHVLRPVAKNNKQTGSGCAPERKTHHEQYGPSWTTPQAAVMMMLCRQRRRRQPAEALLAAMAPAPHRRGHASRGAPGRPAASAAAAAAASATRCPGCSGLCALQGHARRSVTSTLFIKGNRSIPCGCLRDRHIRWCRLEHLPA